VADIEQLVLSVNGDDVVVRCAPSEPLAQVLSRDLRLTSVRETCMLGVCGTCTVLLDDEPVSACLLPTVAAVGRRVTTLEGIGDRHELHPVQRAFVEEQAFQCAYCTPGFILTTIALLADERRGYRYNVGDAFAGHLCRCGSYEFIERAVERARTDAAMTSPPL
jgi:aerobic-type carbon monoxide dehydrogenase small subunit (CoxS/CutS family)